MQDFHAEPLDLNLLLALDALLTERSVTRAAQRVGLTQSAMSHRLRRLRDRFDDQLLVGGRQGMVLTERAVALAEPIRRGLLELHAAIRSTAPFDPATAQRSFSIATSDYADFVVLPRVLAYIGQHAPGVSLRMVSIVDDPLPAMERGEMDLMMGMPIEGAALRQRAVFDETPVVILRQGHPALEDSDTLSLDRYLELGHVLVSGEGGPKIVDRMLDAQALTRRVILRTPYFVGVPFIVASSDLVATVPRSLAERAATFAPLRLLPPPIPMPAFRITMTWHERVHRDPAHRWLRDLARNMTIEALAEHRIGEARPAP